MFECIFSSYTLGNKSPPAKWVPFKSRALASISQLRPHSFLSDTTGDFPASDIEEIELHAPEIPPRPSGSTASSSSLVSGGTARSEWCPESDTDWSYCNIQRPSGYGNSTRNSSIEYQRSRECENSTKDSFSKFRDSREASPLPISRPDDIWVARKDRSLIGGIRAPEKKNSTMTGGGDTTVLGKIEHCQETGISYITV